MGIQPYRDALRGYATDLRGAYPVFPVQIERICADHGALVTKSDRVEAGKAYLRIARSSSESSEIILSSHTKSSSYIRFCIAHELAHLLLYDWYCVVPEGTSDYWKYEAVCDEFARYLLIPEGVVKEASTLWRAQPFSMIDSVKNVARQAVVPLSQAAARLCVDTDFRAFRLLDTVQGLERRVTGVNGKGARIEEGSELYRDYEKAKAGAKVNRTRNARSYLQLKGTSPLKGNVDIEIAMFGREAILAARPSQMPLT